MRWSRRRRRVKLAAEREAVSSRLRDKPREREAMSADEDAGGKRGAVAHTPSLRARNDSFVEAPGDPRVLAGALLRGRVDRVELVVQECAARVVHDRHDSERDAAGDQAILDSGGCTFIG